MYEHRGVALQEMVQKPMQHRRGTSRAFCRRLWKFSEHSRAVSRLSKDGRIVGEFAPLLTTTAVSTATEYSSCPLLCSELIAVPRGFGFVFAPRYCAN